VLVLSHLHLRFALVMMRKTMISPHRVGGKNNQKNERVLHFEKSSSFSSFSPRAHPSISLLKCDDDDERALLCASVYLFVSSRQNMMNVFFFVMSFLNKKEYLKSSSRWTTLEGKFDLIRVFDEYNVCVYVNVGL
jgi:hypothetical protein